MIEKIDISIVIPVFNEAARLPAFLSRVIAYCNSSKKKYEIIIVDDGSRDKTYEAAMAHKTHFCSLSVEKFAKNEGKGYAVKRGFLKSKGNIRLFLDADGSVGPEEIGRNLHYLTEEGYDIFIGSRVLRDKDQTLVVKWYRKFIGIVFNFLVHAILFKNISDTQCGFKMFKGEVVTPLFSRSYLKGFGFDMEILYLAHKMGYRVKEGAVSWRHMAGSKVNLFTDGIRMFLNILQIRNWHWTPINPFGKYLGPDEYKYMYDMEKRHWWFTGRRALIVHLIKSSNIISPQILDVGCGTGANLLAFGKMGKAFGIDISARAIKFCKKRGVENVIQCSAEKIEYADKTFDIITCLDLLEHVADPVEMLAELKRVLKDDGKIIIAVPAFRFLWSQHDEALCHLRRYTKKSLLSDLKNAGLKSENNGYFFFLSFFAVAPIRMMRKFLVSNQVTRSDTTTLPPKYLNEFLKFLFKIELIISGWMRLPFGTTIYTIASKNGRCS
ncbi:MAG: glycosyltransferase [Candidatus Omnitrophica bacterium]|nr:glycosyltransferase [Candidatus Omnitrophota bacterium]